MILQLFIFLSLSVDTSNVHKHVHVTKSVGAEFGALHSSDWLAEADFLHVTGCVRVKGLVSIGVNFTMLVFHT